ncbi:hypothetical protein CTZ27_03000 [Streptomyces griseocarneus]|nr:hypothetical protein CTZ27_03000 [Streptomyces griseocarneus]
MNNPASPFPASAPWDTVRQAPAPAPAPVVHQEQPPASAPTNYAPAPVGLPAEYKVGSSLKAGAGHHAEWITPSVTATTPEAAAQGMAALLRALHEQGVIATVAQAAQATRDAHLGGSTPTTPAAAPPRFEGGQVVPAAGAAPQGEHQGDVTCVHGARNYRTGIGKTGHPYEAMFCPTHECDPAFKQRNGRFVIQERR